MKAFILIFLSSFVCAHRSDAVTLRVSCVYDTLIEVQMDFVIVVRDSNATDTIHIYANKYARSYAENDLRLTYKVLNQTMQLRKIHVESSCGWLIGSWKKRVFVPNQYNEIYVMVDLNRGRSDTPNTINRASVVIVTNATQHTEIRKPLLFLVHW
jgi:hypothetical protein